MAHIKFYIITNFPYSMASGRRRLCYAKGLMAAGDTCEVVACRKMEPFGKEDGMPSVGYYNGIPYNYINGKYKSTNKIRRGLDYHFFDFIGTAIYALKNIHKYDLIFLYFHGFLFHMLLLLIAKAKGAKVVREVCEYPFGTTKESLKNKILRFLDLNFMFPFFDGFIVISTALEELVYKFKSKNAKVIRIPILVENKFINKHTFQRKVNVPYILHTGTLHEQKDGISGIIKAYSLARKHIPFDVKLIFTGVENGKVNSVYLKLVKYLDLSDSVVFLDYLSNEDLLALQYYATAGVVNKMNNMQNKYCFPTKMGELLLSKTLVITTTVGDANLYLKDNDSAYIIPPGDVELMADQIVKAFVLEKDRLRIVEKGYAVALSSFDPISQGKRLSSFYRSLNSLT